MKNLHYPEKNVFFKPWRKRKENVIDSSKKLETKWLDLWNGGVHWTSAETPRWARNNLRINHGDYTFDERLGRKGKGKWRRRVRIWTQWLESFRSRGPLLLRSLAQSKRGVYTVIVAMQHFPSPSRALLAAVCTIARGFAQRSRNARRAFRKMRRGQGQGQVHSRIITLSISIPRVAQHLLSYSMEFSLYETFTLNLNFLLINYLYLLHHFFLFSFFFKYLYVTLAQHFNDLWLILSRDKNQFDFW